jgi:hypothetical protein
VIALLVIKKAQLISLRIEQSHQVRFRLAGPKVLPDKPDFFTMLALSFDSTDLHEPAKAPPWLPERIF